MKLSIELKTYWIFVCMWMLCTGVAVAQDAIVIKTGFVASTEQHRAVVKGVLTAVTQPTQVWCEFGTSTSYGQSTSALNLNAGDAPVATIAIENLDPQTLYHYRLATRTSSGVSYSNDLHFETVAQGTVGEELASITVGNGGKQTLGLWLGVHPRATECIDTDLGEEDLKSVPDGDMFDARFVNVRSNEGDCLGAGVLKDYRPLHDPGQADTFLVKFQAGAGGYPVTISWPDLSAWFSGHVRMLIPGDQGRVGVNMMVMRSYTIPDPSIDHFYIVSGSGPAGIEAPAVVDQASSEEGQTTARLSADVLPNGLETSAWFEWGSTTEYSDSSDPQTISATDPTGVVSAVLNNLAAEATYHYRIVAKNSIGYSYGDDQTFTTVGNGIIGNTIFRFMVGDTGRSTQGLWIGVHPHGTVCLDPDLGERPLLPKPIRSVFDARLIDGACNNLGLHVDLRPFTDSARIDTYKVEIQTPPGSGSLVLSWDDVTGYYNGNVQLIDTYGGLAVNVDMRSQTQYTLDDPDIRSLYIITGGGDGNDALPSVLTELPVEINASAMAISARVNPNGSETSAWFEWGAGDAPTGLVQLNGHIVPKGKTVSAVAETLANLEPGKAYYYRIVAQNSRGIRKGPDRMMIVTLGDVAATYPDGWSIVSQPAGTSEVSFGAAPQAVTSPYFEFRNGYTQAAAMEDGKGYWVKFNGGASAGFTGKMNTSDTVYLRQGWNMIGGLGYPVDVTTVGGSASGMVLSSFFGYTARGYRQADTLQPGFGYWVKSQSEGAIVLTAHINNFSLPKIGRLPGAGEPPPPPASSDEVVRAVKAATNVPVEFALLQNFPNPFNPTTQLRFDLPVDSRVTLKVYNVLGAEVATVLNDVSLTSGHQSVSFSSEGLSSGVYFYRIQAGALSAVRKMTIMK